MTISQRVAKYKSPNKKAVIPLTLFRTVSNCSSNLPAIKQPQFSRLLMVYCLRCFCSKEPVDRYGVLAPAIDGANKYIKCIDKDLKTLTKIAERHPDALPSLDGAIKYFNNRKSCIAKIINNTCESVISPVPSFHDQICLLASFTAYEMMLDQSPANIVSRYNNADLKDIGNLEVMLMRSIGFFEKERLNVINYPTYLNDFAYSETITSGRPDLLCDDALVRVSLSKSKPNSKDTLHILTEYVMGLQSGIEHYKNVKRIVIWNPFMDAGYICDVSDIPKSIIDQVKTDVIQYTWELPSNTTSNKEVDPSSTTRICEEWGFK